jgi:hypothetical protein
MTKALEELRTRFMDFDADLRFISLAARLRPRLGDVVNWTANHDVTDLAREFMGAKEARVEGIYGPLLVRLLAAFERYIRALVAEVLTIHSGNTRNYDELHSTIKTRNTVLTGALLATMESPREHLAVQFEELIVNLASCRSGSTTYLLNPGAFAAVVTGASPPTLERALQNVGVEGWWDKIGSATELSKVLGTRGARDTAKQAKTRLGELWRWRNHLAHGGDEEIALTEDQLKDCLAFVRAFTIALDRVALKVVKA